MYYKILKLLVEYSCEKRKFIDSQYIKEIFDTVVDGKKLSDYVTNVRVYYKELYKDRIAFYNSNEKCISLHMENLKDQVLKEALGVNDKISSDERIIFANLLATQAILQELVHVDMFKKLDTNHNIPEVERKTLLLTDTNALILETSKKPIDDFDFFASTLPKLFDYYDRAYEEGYKVAPVERYAQIESLKEILNIIQYASNELETTERYFNNHLLEEQINGYKKGKNNTILTPTSIFIKYIISDKKLSDQLMKDEFDWYNPNYILCLLKSKFKYNLDERLYHGMMISNKEFDNIHTRIREYRSNK